MPSETEIAEITSHEGDFDNLMDSDIFCLSMGSVPYYDLRLKSIVFINTYKKEIKEIMDKVDTFYEMFEFFKSNKLLMHWLEYILAVGNYLNGTSTRFQPFLF